MTNGSLMRTIGTLGGVASLFAVLLVAAPALAVDGLSFVRAYRNGVDGIDGLRGPVSVVVSGDGANVYAAGNYDDAIVVFQRDTVSGELGFVEVQRNGIQGVVGLESIVGVTVSPDGRNVYAAANGESAVAVFRRESPSGALSFVEVQRDGVNGVEGLAGAYGVAVSPDGAQVYVTSIDAGALVVFERDAATGALAFAGVHKDGVNGVRGLAGANAVAVSPDGTSIYVTGGANDVALAFGAVAVFRRDPKTAALTFVEVQGGDRVDGLFAVDTVTVSPDGAHVYAASVGDDAVVAFERNPSTGALTFVEKQGEEHGILNGASAVAVSPNGANVYLTARGFYANTLVVFSRDAVTGMLSLVEVHPHDAGIVDGLDFPVSVALSPDGAHVYVAGRNDDAVALFRIRPDAPTATQTFTLTPTPTPTITPTPTLTITPGGPSLTPTPTRTSTSTPTSNRPIPVARGRAYPNPARSGEIVTLDGSESTGAIRSAEWVQSCGGPKVELASPDGLSATFVVPPVSQETTLTFTLTLSSFGGTPGDRTQVDVTIVPLATTTPAPRPKRFAYVASSDFCSVWGIDLSTNSVYATIRVGVAPNAVAITPDGKSAYVANSAGAVSVIDTATSTVSTTLAVDSPSGIAVTPDGKYVYVTSTGSSSISVIDTETHAVVDVIALLPRAADPLQIAFTPSGELAYVTTPGFPEAQSVSVIDTASHDLVSIIPFSEGTFPEGISVTVDGRVAVVTNSVDDSLSFIDTTTNMIAATVPVGHSPVSVAVSPNGAVAYVANLSSDTMSVVDIPARRVSATVPVASPAGVAVAPDGRYAYVSNLGLDTVSVIDTKTNARVTAIPVGNMPRGIALGPACAGDCDGSGDVTIAELIRIVTIALGNADVSACLIADADGSGTISVDRIVAAVNRALTGCP